MNNDYLDYLQHHGILGMKWGIRRYQNKDGSLTPEGKKRLQNKTYRKDRKMADRSSLARKIYDEESWMSPFDVDSDRMNERDHHLGKEKDRRNQIREKTAKIHSEYVSEDKTHSMSDSEVLDAWDIAKNHKYADLKNSLKENDKLVAILSKYIDAMSELMDDWYGDNYKNDPTFQEMVENAIVTVNDWMDDDEKDPPH